MSDPVAPCCCCGEPVELCVDPNGGTWAEFSCMDCGRPICDGCYNSGDLQAVVENAGDPVGEADGVWCCDCSSANVLRELDRKDEIA